jgi:flagellar biogenesis protein FliO
MKASIASLLGVVCLALLAFASAASADEGQATAATLVAPPPASGGGPLPERLLAPVALEPVALAPLALEPLAAAGDASPARVARSPAALLDWKAIAFVATVGLAALLLRRFAPRATSTLPPDVFAVLGEASLGGQQMVRVVRFGPKTLLVSVTPSGCHTLAELGDPEATACIAAACRAGLNRSGRMPAAVQPPLAAVPRGVS